MGNRPLSRTWRRLGVLLLLLLPLGCGGGGGGDGEGDGGGEFPLDPVLLVPQLDLDLAEHLGTKQWVLGIFAASGASGDGAAYLLTSYDLLQADEQLPAHSFARLEGTLPPDAQDGAEILVYGLVSDFETATGLSAVVPTALVTVETWHIAATPMEASGLDDSLPAPLTFPEGDGPPLHAANAPSACDRVLVISGGIDASNNHARYAENIKQIVMKMKALGFTDAQISVLYDDGTAIDVDGTNAVDDKATKAKIQAAIDDYVANMPASCTLTVFVTDHGTGYNSGKPYSGARRAAAGAAETGATYAESTFLVDVRKKVYRVANWTNGDGVTWSIYEDKATGKLQLFEKVGGNWVLRGSDTNGDGRITEAETGTDVDGDGDTDDLGWDAAQLGAWRYNKNEWDTDRDGTNDVRVRWDGTRYVFERLDGATWKEMGRDTNGDHKIDSTDGGVDWDLDGSKDDQVGFHEGINLWGKEVLWDDGFATMLKPLSDKGVHILVEMVQCYGGGFIENLEGIVEKIVVSSDEDKVHWNRKNGEGKWEAVDLGAFLANLLGIDIESWNHAADKAKEADDAAWTAAGSDAKNKNDHARWEKPVVPTESTYTESGGNYLFRLRIPPTFPTPVHDMEIIFGLQNPRWTTGNVGGLPAGFTTEAIPGGVRIIHQDGEFPADPGGGLLFQFSGAANGQVLRIQLTDENHDPIAYILPMREP